MRQLRYQLIADEIRSLVGAGEYGPGQLLPSESELARRHGASRVTVRRALEVLRDEGRIDARQGLGWFVASDPVRQSLGRLGTIERQLTERGLTSRRRILDFGFVRAPRRARDLFGDETVLRVRRLNLADGAPFARVTVWCPEDLGASLSRDEVEQRSFLELLPVTLGHATQTIGAIAAGSSDANRLDLPVGSPLLRCERITYSIEQRAVLLSEFVFPGHLTEFMVELPNASPSIAPSGLRLVGEEGV